MVLVPPVAALESRIAWRSEPGPLSAVVVTTKTAVRDDELALDQAECGRRPRRSRWQSRSKPGRRRVTSCRPGPRPAPRACRCTTTMPVPSPDPVRPAVLERRQRPGRDRERQAPGRRPTRRRPDPGGRCHRPRPTRRSATAGPVTSGIKADRAWSPPGERRDLGGIALGVGGRGRDDRQTRPAP